MVRYYVSQQAIRHGYRTCPVAALNAQMLDDLVRALVDDHLRQRHGAGMERHEPAVRDRRLRELIHQVTVAPDWLRIDLDRAALDSIKPDPGAGDPPARAAALDMPRDAADVPSEREAPDVLAGGNPKNAPDFGDDQRGRGRGWGFRARVEERGPRVRLTLKVVLKRHAGQRVLITPDGQDLRTLLTPQRRAAARVHLVQALGQAYAWRAQLLESAGTIAALAARCGVADTRVHTLLSLTRLSPSILSAALAGTLPDRITLDDLLRAARSLDWQRQADLLQWV